MGSLRCYLSDIQIRQLESIVQKCEPHLGVYSFRTPDSAFWVHGNMFIRLEQFSDEPFDFELAVKLDSYLSAHPERHAPLGLKLDRGTLPGVVKCGKMFRMGLKGEPSAWAEEKKAMRSCQDVVATVGPLDEKGMFELYAVGPGAATVTILGAGKQPLGVTFEVVMWDAAVEDPYAGMAIGSFQSR